MGAALLAGVVVCGVSVPAGRAQTVVRPSIVNPAFTVAPGIQQYSNLYNTAILGRTIRQIPRWAYGYNPYGSPIGNLGVGAAYVPPIYPALGSYAGLGGYPSSAMLTTNPYGGYPSSAMLTTNPYGGATSGYGGYGGSGYGGNTYGSMDPNYGFLSGTANVIDASGNYLKSVQDARLKQTTADEARIDYRRRLIDEARYERGLLPTTEELRQQELTRNLDWYRRQPPISDITSARALNALLNHLTSDPAVGKGPNVPIDEDVLKRINVTSPNLPGASLGLLRDDGKLSWPQSLGGKEFEGARTDLNQRLQTVVAALKFSNKPEKGAISDLNGDLKKLRDAVEKSDLSPTEYIEARTYLDQVGATIQALDDPNVAANFNHKFNAKNVAELIDGMKGLDFAPAAPGDEWAYRVLHQALVAYDYGASGKATPAAPPAPKEP